MNDALPPDSPSEAEILDIRKRGKATADAIAGELRSEMARQMVTNRELSRRLAARGEPRSEPTLSRLLRGKQPLSLTDMFVICDALGLSVRDVVTAAYDKARDGEH